MQGPESCALCPRALPTCSAATSLPFAPCPRQCHPTSAKAPCGEAFFLSSPAGSTSSAESWRDGKNWGGEGGARPAPPARSGVGMGWGGEGTGVGSAAPSAGAGDKGLSDRHYCLRAAGLRGPRVAPGWSGTVAGSNLLVVSRRDLCSCQAAFTATSELRPRAALLPRPSVNGAKEKGKQPKVPPLSLRVL